MTGFVRASLLGLGLAVVALLIWRAGVGVVLSMLTHVGWRLAAVAAIYAAHVTIRAWALWRTMLDRRVRFTDVLRIRLSGEAVETLTFTGPFLAEPVKGWLLVRRGVDTAAAFAAVITEYLLYAVMAAVLAVIALWLLLTRHALPSGFASVLGVVLILTIAFLGAFTFASTTGIGLIAPGLRAIGIVLGWSRAQRAADDFRAVEDLIIRFLHGHPARLAEVLAIEAAAHALLVADVIVAVAGLGFSISRVGAVIVEGGVKVVDVAFAFVPGQLGASEGAYAWLAGAVGLPTAAGLSLALVRRFRGWLVALAGLVVLTMIGDASRS